MSIRDGFNLWAGQFLFGLTIFTCLLAIGCLCLLGWWLWDRCITLRTRFIRWREKRELTIVSHRACRARLAELLPDPEMAYLAYLSITCEDQLELIDPVAAAEREALNWPKQEPPEDFGPHATEWLWMLATFAAILVAIGYCIWYVDSVHHHPVRAWFGG